LAGEAFGACGASTRYPNSIWTRKHKSRPRLADEIGASPAVRKSAFTKALFFAGKVIVSAACFWYVLRQINLTESIRTLPTVDVRWAAFAVSVAMAQIPLLALRLWAIVQSSRQSRFD
jgi:hypothetical protein